MIKQLLKSVFVANGVVEIDRKIGIK